MDYDSSTRIAIIWAIISEFGWVPLLIVLRACGRRREAGIVLGVGLINLVVAFVPVLFGLFGDDTRESTLRGRQASFSYMLASALLGLSIAAIVAAVRWRSSGDRRLLMATVASVSLASASLYHLGMTVFIIPYSIVRALQGIIESAAR